MEFIWTWPRIQLASVARHHCDLGWMTFFLPLHPRSLSVCPLENGGWKTTFLLGRPIFSGYVSFREGIFSPRKRFNNSPETLEAMLEKEDAIGIPEFQECLFSDMLNFRTDNHRENAGTLRMVP